MISNDFLDEEREKLWKEVLSLKDDVALLRVDLDKGTSDYEAEAKQSSRKSSEYRNRSQAAKEAAESALESIHLNQKYIDALHRKFRGHSDHIDNVLIQCNEATNKFDNFYTKIKDLETLLSKYDDYVSQINDINSYHDQSEETNSKINVLYSAISNHKKEVDEIYLSIFGFEENDEETGEARFISGKKQELEKAYSALSSGINEAESNIESLKESTSQSNEEFLNEQAEKVGEQIEKWDTEHASTTKKIKDLLPDALTTGLSHAFSEKRKSEINSGEKLSRVFGFSILGLVIVSLIPFGVNAYLLSGGKGLEDVIRDLPRLLTSIIPLYIPLVWLAYSSNKKANLSKRLVEEYTHKEVLSKTFEGLSSQIESIEEESISSELRIKLLYNLLEVSAENPGKLISNYNSSDHPLIDALETSSKLGENMRKLDKFPGLAKISELLDKRAKRLLKEQTDNIADALEAVND
tara:strand:- start:2648 stop:4048 length:1401 start_codon:yes stop_codon:yes gene_type:complete